jgi:hypothetical protein
MNGCLPDRAWTDAEVQHRAGDRSPIELVDVVQPVIYALSRNV